MKKIFVVFVLVSIYMNMKAQTYNIEGTIREHKKNIPIEFVSVSLLKPDSAFVEGVTTDSIGHFILPNINNGDYLLSVSYTGYKSTALKIDHLEKDITLNDIFLEESSVQLQEVTVTAQSVIQKSDRTLITPSQAQVQASTNATDLIRKLNIPRINVDPLSNAITTFMQGGVQLRINGVEVTSNDVAAIRAEDIVRIEYHDEPGLRYGNVSAVLDFITRRKESGGNIFLNAMQGIDPDKGFTEDRISAKVNHKKSEFGIAAHWSARDIKWTRENTETFVFPTQPTLYRTEIGEPTKFKYDNLNMSANYNLMDEKYFFNATFRGSFSDTPNNYSDRRSTVMSSYGGDPVHIADLSTENSKSPSLDLYYQRNLKNDQTLIFNVVGTYIDTENNRSYQEHKSNTLITDIQSNIKGDKYSLISEAIYEKKLKAGKISGGLKHSQSYTNNQYLGNTTAMVNMKTAETYGYVEYLIKHKKFTYTLGLGAQRNYYSQGGDATDKTFLKPLVRITYNINDYTYLRLNSIISAYAPSLASLNNVRQDIDSLQIRVGNSSLKPVKYYSNTLTGGYNKGIVGVNMYVLYRYDHKPEMDRIDFDAAENKFIRTTSNQRGHHNFRADMSLSLKPWKDYISISVTPGITRYISQGDNYTHTYTGKYVRANVWLNYRYWGIGGEYRTYDKYLSSETLSSNEKSHLIYAGYNNKKLNLAINLAAFNPFTKRYEQITENWSALAPSISKVYTNSLSPMFMLGVTYNFSFGRQYQAGDKRTDNKDSDSGIMSGTKK